MNIGSEDVLTWLPVILSLAALSVSVWSIIESKRSSRREHQLQERLLSLETARERKRDAEAKRATVVAFISGPSDNRCLYLRNEGSGTARAVKVHVDGMLSADHEYILGDPPPSGILSTKAEYGIPLLSSIDAPDSIKVRISWEDDSAYLVVGKLICGFSDCAA